MTSLKVSAPLSSADLAAEAMLLLGRIAETEPRVHCLTNTVAEPITANALLALGAIPSLTTDPDELSDFLGSADALMVNLGTPSSERLAARRFAAHTARRAGMPWVLDPVFADRSGIRREEATRLIADGPSLIRGNGGEIGALGPSLSGFQGIVARTGETDVLLGHGRRVRLRGGHPYLARVTAAGCALSAVLAAFLAVSRDDLFMGAAAGLASFAAAGAKAGETAAGPGSFATGLLDALASLDAEVIAAAVAVVEDDEP